MDREGMLQNSTVCRTICGSHGECMHGTCICSVQYAGWSCSETNLPYYVSFTAFFYVICIAAFVLLTLRMRSELRRSESSFLQLLKMDNQKLIYFFVICATGSRAVYFLSGIEDIIPPVIQKILFFMFYPFMLSGFSLIICFWAESFHLYGLELEKPRFLTKSCCFFVVFNIFVYVVFIGIVVVNILNFAIAEKINEIFNICIAVLLFLILIFFLIYGVELFCKIKGAFKKVEPRTQPKHINYDQLLQSRIGLIAEACLQLSLSVLLAYEVSRKIYRHKLTMFDQNVLKILFHMVELGSVMWFPCCLWNVNKPDQLWILNPRNLFTFSQQHQQPRNQEPLVQDLREDPDKHLDEESAHINIEVATTYRTFSAEKLDSVDSSCSFADNDLSVSTKFNSSVVQRRNNCDECWICLSNEHPGDMIQPCNCKGGMRLVHHECLKTWVMEQARNTDVLGERPQCSVCRTVYHVAEDTRMSCLRSKQECITWSRTVLVSSLLVVIPIGLYFVWYAVHQTLVKVGIFMFLFLVEYVLMKVLGFSFIKAYKVTKRRALTILNLPDAAVNE